MVRLFRRFKEEYREKALLDFIKYFILYPERFFYSHRGKNILKKNKKLISKIKGQRVLILGAGPSANYLKKIPKDVIIMSCNFSPRVLIEKKLKKNLDIYLCSKGNIKRDKEKFFSILSKTKPSFLISDDLKWIMNQKKNIKSILIKDFNYNNYYLNKLIFPKKIKDIQGGSLNHTSSGTRLLQYAIYFGAKEIYLAGIDGGFGGYAWGENRIPAHSKIDNNFMKIVSKKFNNIFSVSKKSPLIKYIPYKKLK